MYSTSNLFRKAFTYAAKKYNLVAILSAEHGLLFPDDKIDPYEVTLNKMKVQERKKWATKVFEQMNNRLCLEKIHTIYFHAGKKYREFLIPKLEKKGATCEIPLEHLRIGKQLAWYKRHLC